MPRVLFATTCSTKASRSNFLATSTDGAGLLHAQRLESADAFLVYWGSADEGWLEPVLTELKKAKGFRKGKPILSKAIFLADPPTVEKRDFLTPPGYLAARVFDDARQGGSAADARRNSGARDQVATP